MPITDDIANSKHASYQHHPVDDIEPEEKAEKPEENKRFIQALSRLLHYINSQSDPRRAVYEIYFAIGKDVALGLTEVDMAKRYGISKQAFSHGVVQCRKALGLPSLQRSEAACRKFALTHERQHGPRTCPVVAETVAIAA